MMPKIPPQLIQMMKGGNPQQIAMNMFKQNTANNPMMENVMGMLNNNDSRGIETIARNLCKSKGIDPDELLRNVQSQFQ